MGEWEKCIYIAIAIMGYQMPDEMETLAMGDLSVSDRGC